MIDIKFRAWDKNKKIMYDSKCLDLLIHFDGSLQSVDMEGSILGTENTPKLELIYYTGVHDDTEDETEIFNNDILEFEYKGEKYIARVEYCQGSYVLVCDELPDGYIVFPDIAENDRDYDWIPNSKVIGNRYTDLPLWLRLVV